MTEVSAASPEESARSDTATLARGGALNLVGMVSYAGFNFALILLVTRRLGAAGAGAFLEAIALFNILAKSLLLGADAGLVRFLPRLRAQGRTDEVGHAFRVAMVPVVVAAVVVGAVVLALAEPLSDLLSNDAARHDLTTYLRVMAVFLPFGALFLLLESGTRGLGTMVPSVAVERIGRSAAQPLAMLIVLSTSLGSAAVALSWVGPTALGLVPLALWAASLVRRATKAGQDSTPAAAATVARPHPSGPPPLATEFWRFSSPRALGGISQVLTIWIGTLLIGALASTREAGIYTASTRWLIIGSFAGLAIVQAIGPQLSHVLATHEHHRAHRLFEVATTWQVLFAFPAYLAVMVYASVLLDAFGSGFGAGRDALVILAAANMLAAACGPVEVVLLMAGKSAQSLAISVGGLAVNVALTLVLVPAYGITGAAIAWAASLFVVNAVPLVQVWKAIRVHPFGPRWLHAAVISLVAVGGVLLAVRLLLGATVLSLLVALVASAAVYAVLLLRFRAPLDLDDFAEAIRHRRREPNSRMAGSS